VKIWNVKCAGEVKEWSWLKIEGRKPFRALQPPVQRKKWEKVKTHH